MRHLLYVAVVFVLIFSSCEDPVQEIYWETQSVPQKIIVEGNITTQLGKHPIKLKYTDDYFRNNPSQKVSGAILSISTPTREIDYIERIDEPGVYEALSDFSGEVNSTYTLNIQLEKEVDGESNYKASTNLVEGFRIDSVTADLFYNPQQDTIVLFCAIYGEEPGNIKNFYMTNIYRNGKLLSDTINKNAHFGDQETGINGNTVLVLFFQDEFQLGDTFGIEILSISEEYNYFLTGINQIAEPGDPFGFSGPPANAKGNINEGKGLGFFFAADVSRGESVVRGIIGD